MKYIHKEPQSLLSKIIEPLITIVKPKSSLKKYLSKHDFSSKKASLPFFIKRKFNVSETISDGRKTWTISSKGKQSGKVVLFIHGGAYVHSLLIFHWLFISKFVKQSAATIVVPDYPLAPLANYKDNFNFIENIYDDLLMSFSPKNITLMGDSAGGGFCLSFAQYLAEKNKAQAAQLILIAPWLDISMENPAIKTIEEKDKMLDVEGLKMAGKAYAADLDVQNYLVSPIFGKFDNLPKISVFIGGHDILLKDCEKLYDIFFEKNIALNYFEYPKMIHDWIMLTPLKEAQFALKQIVNLMK